MEKQENNMPDEAPPEQTPVYTFQGNTPAEVPLEIARIHHLEAKQLFERAQEAEVADRPEEAKLLKHLAAARKETAVEFEKVAKGEASDPIVTEILDWQEDIAENYVPYQSTYVAPDDGPPPVLPPKPKTLTGILLNFVAWVGGWFA